MLTTRITLLAAGLTLIAAGAVTQAGIIIEPPDSEFVNVPSKSVGSIFDQEPVMFTSFGMFGTLTEPRGITQQILITTEDTASLPGAAEDTEIALFNSFGDLLAIGSPGFGGIHSVIDIALTAGEYYVAVTSPGATFGDAFSVMPADIILPGAYSMRIMMIPAPATIVMLCLGGALAALRRREREEDTA